jgi:hypothetical protein
MLGLVNHEQCDKKLMDQEYDRQKEWQLMRNIGVKHASYEDPPAIAT